VNLRGKDIDLVIDGRTVAAKPFACISTIMAQQIFITVFTNLLDGWMIWV